MFFSYFLLKYSIFLKKFKPYCASLRHKVRIQKWCFGKKKLLKLSKYFFSKSGRNLTGTITVRHRGGSKNHKCKFVQTLNRKQFLNAYGIVLSILTNKLRTCFTGLIKYTNGAYTYILLPHACSYGSLYLTAYIIFPKITPVKLGFTTYLFLFKLNSIFFNVFLQNPRKSQIAKAAGTFCKLIEINIQKNLILIELPTLQKKWVSFFSTATLGRASNIFHNRQYFGKAGYYRLLNVRPTVRGVAMNPVDHPHGGRTKTNSPEVTP